VEPEDCYMSKQAEIDWMKSILETYDEKSDIYNDIKGMLTDMEEN